ncbi:MAG TPA: methionyl-tRNA formyltransferase [Bacteroidales bacterium]|nr:methionyl-tRNA formyltransferase [Bacteroidales bacterium]
MRIVFMGTPEFAVPSFKKIMQYHSVIGVVTQPDRAKGRGLKVTFSPVKGMALDFGIPILQPEKLSDGIFLNQLRTLEADLFVVVGFRILPSVVFEIPPLGTVNLHASLLPKYRGASPIQWAIINGETETGVSLFFIEKTVDTGDLIKQQRIEIREYETADELHDRLAEIGADLMVECIRDIESGTVKRIRQTGQPSMAPKILPEQCRIQWNKPAKDIVNFIHGVSPVPGAYTLWKKKRLKIYKAFIIKIHDEQICPGKVSQLPDGRLCIRTRDDCIGIERMQIECKKCLDSEEFLRGHPDFVGSILS